MKPTRELYLKAADIMEARGLAKGGLNYVESDGTVCVEGALLTAALGPDRNDWPLFHHDLMRPMVDANWLVHLWSIQPQNTTEMAADKLREIAETLPK